MIEVCIDGLVFLFGVCVVIYFASNLNDETFTTGDSFNLYCGAGASALVGALGFIISLAFAFSDRSRPSDLQRYHRLRHKASHH